MQCSNKKCKANLVEGAAFCHVCGSKQDDNVQSKERRKNGDGNFSVMKNNTIRYYVTMSDGTRKAFYGKTQKECRKKKEEYEEKLRNGDEKMKTATVKDWAVQWLEKYKKGKVAYGTYRNYEDYTNNHIIPALGKYRLDEVKPADIEAFFAQKDRRKLSESACRHIRIALRGIFETAVENDYCNSSPVKAQRRAGNKKLVAPPETYTQEEATKLKEAAAKDINGIYAMFPIYTGLRKGEMLALKWSEIDLVNDVINVKESRARAESGGMTNKTPKSGKQRIIPISKDLKVLLDKQPKNSIYLFSDDGKNPISPNTFDRRYMAFVESVGVRYLTPHKCRHTHGTLLLKGGADLRTTQKILGHSSVKTTELYTHPDIDDLKNSVDKLNI